VTEMTLLFFDGDLMIVLLCDERDSRGKCLRDKMLVEIAVRNTSSVDDFGRKLSSLQLATCVLPSDTQRFVEAYTSALQNSLFRSFINTE